VITSAARRRKSGAILSPGRHTHQRWVKELHRRPPVENKGRQSRTIRIHKNVGEIKTERTKGVRKVNLE